MRWTPCVNGATAPRCSTVIRWKWTPQFRSSLLWAVKQGLLQALHGAGAEGNKIRPAESCCLGRFTGTEEQIMLSNLLFAGVVMFQQPTGEVGWDLVSMWHNMGIPAKSVVAILHHVRLVDRHH